MTTTEPDCIAAVRHALGGLDDEHVHELIENIVGGFIHGMIDDIHARKDEIVRCAVDSIATQLAAVARQAESTLTAVPDLPPADDASVPDAPTSNSDACGECGAKVGQAHVGDCPGPTGRAIGGQASNAIQDAKKRICVICGRKGTRRYTNTELGWRCSPTATKCPGNRTFPPPAAMPDPKRVEEIAASLPGSSDIPVKPIPPKVTPKPAPTPAATAVLRELDSIAAPVADRLLEKPSQALANAEVAQLADAIAKDDITARCTDCPQTWKLTGRVLTMAVDLHEARRGHMVDVLEVANANG